MAFAVKEGDEERDERGGVTRGRGASGRAREDDDDRPRRGRSGEEEERRPRRGRAEEEEERPRRRGREDDEEGEGAPRRGGLLLPILLSAGGLLLLVGVGLGVYFATRPATPPAPAAEQNKGDGDKDKGKPGPSPDLQERNRRAVDDALAGLNGPDEKARQEARKTLALIPMLPDRAKEVGKAVKPLFASGPTRGDALKIARKWPLPDYLDDVLAVLGGSDGALKADAVDALGAYDEERAIAALAAQLDDIHLSGRATTALKAKGRKAQLPVLAYINHGPFVEPKVKEILTPLGPIPDAPLRAQCVKDLSGRRQAVQLEATRRLTKLKPDPNLPEEQKAGSKALEPLLTLWKEKDRLAAREAMEHWATAESVPAILASFDSEKVGADWASRAPLYRALARLKDVKALPRLLRELDLVASSSIGDAIKAFGPVAEPAVLEYIRAQPLRVRKMVHILAKVGGKDSLALLEQLKSTQRQPQFVARIQAAIDEIRARLR